MNYEQSDLDLMKRDVDEFGVEALLTPEALKLLIADLEEARAAAIERAEEFRKEAHAHFVAAGEIEKLEAEISRLKSSNRYMRGYTDGYNEAKRVGLVAK